MLVYLSSMLLYFCVDMCYNTTTIPYTNHFNSGENYRSHQSFIWRENGICNYCYTLWTASPIGNASNYTRFYFFSREMGNNYTEILLGNISSLLQSGFDINKETKVIIHGWLDNGLINFSAEAKDAYLAEQDANIVSVDWSPVAGLFYPLARIAVDPVGSYLAQFLDWLVSQGLPVTSVHISGHSLGAHIAGVAGEHVSSGSLNRITGLDPAGPGFDAELAGRLDSSDAEFVDVIHTAGLWLGYYDACGHIDFYPNRGHPNQPGCPIDFGTCSHIRSYKLFVESISSEGFVSKACDNWSDYSRGLCDNATSAVMGEHVDSSARGKFYLHTAGQFPYALGNITTTNNKT